MDRQEVLFKEIYMNIAITNSHKILIGAALILYIIGLYIGALYIGTFGIIVQIIILGSAIKILERSKKRGAVASVDIIFIIILLCTFILVRAGSAWKKYNDNKINYNIRKEFEKKIAETITPTPSPTPSPLPRNLQTALLKDMTSPSISGSITHIDSDLGIIENVPHYRIDYFEAGKYIKGKYMGYSRIVALVQGEGMTGSPPSTYIFITLDYKKYIVVDNTIKSGLIKDKIEKVEEVESDLPDIIALDGTFALYKREIQVEEDESNIVPTGSENNKYRLRDMYYASLGYKYLSTQNSFLKMYSIPPQTTGGLDHIVTDMTKKLQEQTQDLKDTSGVVVQDSTGLSYSYSLSRLSNIQANPSYTLYRRSSFSSLFLSIKKEEIPTDKDLYIVYDSAVPTNCAYDPETYIVSNISANQLVSIGTTPDGIELFTFRDTNNSLYTLQYKSKPGQIYSNGSGYSKIWSDAKQETVKHPTMEEYLLKNPLILFKDPWNRWVLLGEFEYALQGGCGKPVIYLYPEKSQNITVSFLHPMQFETDIPTYHENWTVNARPDGMLTDLQPQYTDCKAIDYAKKGSEYAAKACKENRYPYLYWSGNTIGATYPRSIAAGWYVKKEEIYSFMEGKLVEIGLNQKERNDMMEYWIPQMQSKNAPYYKISFLTTKEMNKLIPMNIQPDPRSVLRVFLDFLPLSEKPSEPILPQSFSPFVRDGFTVVEWGGLKR